MAAGLRLAIAGSKVAYAVEATAGTRPTTFTHIQEITSIPEISSTDYDKIDMTPIDEETAHIEITGLRQSPGVMAFEANLSDTVQTAWANIQSAYATADAANKATWFCIYIKGMDKSLFFKGEPKALAPAGGDISSGWKCSLPVSMLTNPVWDNKPTIS